MLYLQQKFYLQAPLGIRNGGNYRGFLFRTQEATIIKYHFIFLFVKKIEMKTQEQVICISLTTRTFKFKFIKY